jgi:hypothetical protein
MLQVGATGIEKKEGGREREYVVQRHYGPGISRL